MRPRTGLVAGVLVAVAAGGVAVAVGVALLLANIVHLRSSADATLRTASYLDATIDLSARPPGSCLRLPVSSAPPLQVTGHS